MREQIAGSLGTMGREGRRWQGDILVWMIEVKCCLVGDANCGSLVFLVYLFIFFHVLLVTFRTDFFSSTSAVRSRRERESGISGHLRRRREREKVCVSVSVRVREGERGSLGAEAVGWWVRTWRRCGRGAGQEIGQSLHCLWPQEEQVVLMTIMLPHLQQYS